MEFCFTLPDLCQNYPRGQWDFHVQGCGFLNPSGVSAPGIDYRFLNRVGLSEKSTAPSYASVFFMTHNDVKALAEPLL